jgi:hypothetical protein
MWRRYRCPRCGGNSHRSPKQEIIELVVTLVSTMLFLYYYSERRWINLLCACLILTAVHAVVVWLFGHFEPCEKGDPHDTTG